MLKSFTFTLKQGNKLLEDIKNGHGGAFHEFYCLWNERLYFYFLKKTSDKEIAKELTQLTFIKMWEYRASITEDYSLEIQLFRKAKLVFIDWLRKEALARKRKTAEFEFMDHKLVATVVSNSDLLENAIAKLPPMRRKVIELSHLEGFAYKEIARELNISTKTVDNHIYQGLKQLRKLLSYFFF